MKLLTKKIIKAIPSIYATKDVPLHEKNVICKFFMPDGGWIWYVFEGEQKDDEFLFFGVIESYDTTEMGYFHLSELLKVRGGFRLPIERDTSVFNVPYKNLIGA